MSEPFADGSRQMPQYSQKKFERPSLSSVWSKIASEAAVETLKIVGVVVGILAIIGAAGLVITQEEDKEDRELQAQIAKEDVWMQQCLAEKKPYECEALGEAGQAWFHSHHQHNGESK